MRYIVISAKGPTSYGAYGPDLPGCVAVGETPDKALTLMREAMAMHLASMQAEGSPVPELTSVSAYIEV